MISGKGVEKTIPIPKSNYRVLIRELNRFNDMGFHVCFMYQNQ